MKYSFTDYVVQCAYSVFYWDKLSAGRSQVISWYKSQTSIHVAIAQQIARTIRSGKLGVNPSKLVIIGHSLGSAISNGIVTNDPKVADAVILTGLVYI
jgi:pimeloyl-ACP methyl ester carboxylesterase